MYERVITLTKTKSISNFPDDGAQKALRNKRRRCSIEEESESESESVRRKRGRYSIIPVERGRGTRRNG